ncbi:MAG: hypothetical protein QG604_878 [Candidatus Dependentiae bacterium]|nr:hypothetical protein [Candidatus Dependentiae bacterium]
MLHRIVFAFCLGCVVALPLAALDDSVQVVDAAQQRATVFKVATDLYACLGKDFAPYAACGYLSSSSDWSR